MTKKRKILEIVIPFFFIYKELKQLFIALVLFLCPPKGDGEGV